VYEAGIGKKKDPSRASPEHFVGGLMFGAMIKIAGDREGEYNGDGRRERPGEEREPNSEGWFCDVAQQRER